MNYFLDIIDSYKVRLDEIEKNIQFISLQKKLYQEIRNDQKMANYTNSLENILNSTVQYNSIIICLYGCFEEFIDEMALEYIRIIDSFCTSYNELPQSIRHKHLYKVGEFLSNPQRYKGYELTIEDCVKNIYMSINSLKGRKLNTELIITHAGNLKVDKICDLFKDLGIKNLKHQIEGIVGNKSLNLLDELVEQRNVISHSWKVEQRFDYSKIKCEIITGLRTIGEKLKGILLDEIFLFMYQKGMLEKFDRAITVIHNKILCINSKQSYLKKGDSIFCCKGNDEKVRLEILNLQIDSVNIDEVTKENIDVGIELNDNINASWTYYYKKRC